MLSWLVALAASLLAIGLILAGFLAGLATYGHVYAHFKLAYDLDIKRKVASLELANKRRDERVNVMKEQVRKAYGAIAPAQGEAIDEAIEEMLAQGPGDRK